MKNDSTIKILRITALITVLAGAVGSLYYMFNAGRNQSSVLLIILFTGWVLAPFVALMITHVISKPWPVLPRMILYSMMIVLTIGSLVFYSGLLTFPGTKPAFVFLVVPFISLLIIVVVTLIIRSQLRKSKGV